MQGGEAMAKKRKTLCQCGNWGCLACRESAQSTFVKATEEALSDNNERAMVTLVSEDGLVPFEEICDFDLKAFARRHQAKLKRYFPDDCWFIGAADVSLNACSNKVEGWSFHFHGLLSRSLTKTERKGLKEAYPAREDRGILKPVKVVPIKEGELGKAAEYVYKTYFLKRSRYFAKPNSGRKPYWDSRDIPLTKREEARLQTFLEGYSVAKPIILIGLRRVRTACFPTMKFVEVER
jgi:hypothetical protein